MMAANQRETSVSKRRVRPGEVLIVSAALGVFVGIVVMVGTREWKLAFIFAGVGFIVGVVVFSVLSLASAPKVIDGPVLGEPTPRVQPHDATTEVQPDDPTVGDTSQEQ